ncbi:MAG: Sua5/YciO/YrdC/YwlC family protein [Bacteriovorax sp.]|jgi:L-threonylcarbamoyladenylate synthase
MSKINNDIYIYPTDTVWGIGCSIYSRSGYEKIADIKKSEKNKPLSIMFGSIDDVVKYFQLPEGMTSVWMKNFFKLETTLGLPLKFAKIPIPEWVSGGSDFISLRCLETEAVKFIYHELHAPFFSTSLNITGDAPITELSAALNFQKKYAPGTHLVNSSLTTELSGSSSTIVFFKKKLEFEIIREGKRIIEVKEQLKKLSGR